MRLTSAGLQPDPAAPNAKPARRPRGRPPLGAEFQRARILSAAMDLFIQCGFVETSVEAIGKAAGVTKRAIYEMIGNKEELFRATCTALCATAWTFDFDVSAAHRPVRAILIDMAHTLLRYALSADAVAFSRLIAVESLRFPDLVVMVMDEGRGQMHRAIADVFAEMIASERVAPIDPSEAADMFYDLIVGAKAMRATLGYDEPCPPAIEVERRVDMMIAGYLRQ